MGAKEAARLMFNKPNLEIYLEIRNCSIGRMHRVSMIPMVLVLGSRPCFSGNAHGLKVIPLERVAPVGHSISSHCGFDLISRLGFGLFQACCLGWLSLLEDSPGFRLEGKKHEGKQPNQKVIFFH